MRKSTRKKIQDTKIVLKIGQYIYDSCEDDAKSKQKYTENLKLYQFIFWNDKPNIGVYNVLNLQYLYAVPE